MKKTAYDRLRAAEYAQRWALGRNPAYYDFDPLGGDCTNFVSQCVFAGCGVMNFTPEVGWYYVNLNDRSAAWTGVSAFYRFMTQNQGAGPYAVSAGRTELLPGDVIQLGTATGAFYHSLLVLDASPSRVYVAAHTVDSLWRPLDSYTYERIRYLHILGART